MLFLSSPRFSHGTWHCHSWMYRIAQIDMPSLVRVPSLQHAKSGTAVSLALEVLAANLGSSSVDLRNAMFFDGMSPVIPTFRCPGRVGLTVVPLRVQTRSGWSFTFSSTALRQSATAS